MNNLRDKEKLSSTIYVLTAYFTWSFFPIYWSFFDYVPATEVLAHRMIWSLVCVVLIIILTKKAKLVIQECIILFKNRRQLLAITTAAFFITLNWYTYIWAVNHGYLFETSLGYYINPLFSVLLGVFVLKERLSFWQKISLLLAAIGVLNFAFHIGTFPWVAMTLAISFTIYGFIKKTTELSALASLFIETLFITPIALIYIFSIVYQGQSYFSLSDVKTSLLLIGGGIVTAIPLILFAKGAKGIPLTFLGFLQYFTPTIVFLLGVFVFHEPFTQAHLISFIFIWSALIIFSLTEIREIFRMDKMHSAKKTHIS